MTKRIMTFFALAFVTISAYTQASSQSRCNLTEANSPSVRGLRIGMSMQQLLALFPNASRRKEVREALDNAKAPTVREPVYLAFYPATDAEKQQFTGVDSVSAVLYKGRVVDLSVLYVGATWDTIDQWVAKLSEAFKLPRAQDWVAGPDEDPNKVLRCAGIEIEAAIQGGSASIRIWKPEYLKEIEERTNAGAEKKRQEIRP